MRRASLWLGAALFVLPALAFALGALSLTVSAIEHPAFALSGLRLTVGADGAVLDVDRVRLGDHHWRALRLRCAHAELGAEVLRCARGRLALGGAELPFTLDVDIDPQRASGRIALLGGDGARAVATFDGRRVQARFAAIDLAALAPWLPEGPPWQLQGRFDGELDWVAAPAGRVRVVGTLADAGFASADGLRAGEHLGARIALDARARAGGWAWSAMLDWHAGAAYWHPFYVEAGAQVHAAGRYAGDLLEVEAATVTMAGVEQFAATLVLDVARGAVRDAGVALANADLALIGPRWLAPLLAPAAGERLVFAGRVSAGLQLVDGELVALDAVFDEAGFSLAGAAGGSGIAFGPVSGAVPWRREAVTRAELDIGGGRWEQLALGAFRLGARLAGDEIVLDRSTIPLLDGAMVVDGLQLVRTADGWEGRGSMVIEPVSMGRLTAALDLPAMGGVLAASLPGLRIRPGEIVLDGALVVSVFDGYVQATHLRVVEPFGVASVLSADIEARHLDLAQLTETFSFGSITGFVDADISDLELRRWRPVKFDARVASSAGRYPRRISQRAVQNIGALGGAGAMAAVQRSLLSVFDTFGYRELGLRCVLERGVCTLAGVGGAGADAAGPGGAGFAIVRGGGIPALDVIGYNRRVDWAELVGRLQRVIDDNVTPVTR